MEEHSTFTDQEEVVLQVSDDLAKRQKHENKVLNHSNDFFSLMEIVQSRFRSEQTKVKALEKIKKLCTKEGYEYALEMYFYWCK